MDRGIFILAVAIKLIDAVQIQAEVHPVPEGAKAVPAVTGKRTAAYEC